MTGRVVIGVDPGARSTGIAVVDLARGTDDGPPPLLWSQTVARIVDESLIENPPPSYLHAVVYAVACLTDEHRPALIAVEGIARPRWHNGGKASPIDPAPLLGTAQVVGALLAASTIAGSPVTRVRPGRNGHLFPLTRYPDRLATQGKGQDSRRHERSAYDVAVTAHSNLQRGRT